MYVRQTSLSNTFLSSKMPVIKYKCIFTLVLVSLMLIRKLGDAYI